MLQMPSTRTSVLVVTLCLCLIGAAASQRAAELEGSWSETGPQRSRTAREVEAYLEEELDERDNCSDINNPPPQYNGSVCEMVLEECEDKYELLNYLRFVTCDLGESLLVRRP